MENRVLTIREYVQAVRDATDRVDLWINPFNHDPRQEDMDALIGAFNQNTNALREIVCRAGFFGLIDGVFRANISSILRSILSQQRTALTVVQLNLCCGGQNHRDHAEIIANFIRTTQTLKELDLSNNDFDDEDCRVLIDALSVNKSIKILSLNENHGIGDGSAEAFANDIFLKNKGCLQELYLDHTGITSVGFRALATSIRHTLKLQKLHLQDSGQFTHEDLELLKQSVQISHSMKEVEYSIVGSRFNNPYVWWTYQDIRALCRQNGEILTAYEHLRRDADSTADDPATSTRNGGRTRSAGGGGRRIQEARSSIPLGLWPHILSKFGARTSALYLVLSEFPNCLLGAKGGGSRRRRRRHQHSYPTE